MFFLEEVAVKLVVVPEGHPAVLVLRRLGKVSRAPHLAEYKRKTIKTGERMFGIDPAVCRNMGQLWLGKNLARSSRAGEHGAPPQTPPCRGLSPVTAI